MKLTTRYMNLTLKNPLVASASPLSQRLDTIRQLEDRGAAAIVMFSLFEEQIREDAAAMEYFMTVGTDSFGEALSYFPMVERCEVGPSQYLELIRKATAAVDIPIIASLNGTSDRGWVDFAALMEEAGARAIELNIYYIPTAMHRTGAQVEEQYVDVVARVKSAVSVPVAVKVGPYFSSFAHMAGRLDRAGANALVLFNRFYQPDFDIENRTVVPSLALSTPDEIRLPLLWIALLHGNVRGARRCRGDQIPDGRRRCGDEHVSTAAPRTIVAHDDPGGSDGLDGPQGIRVGRSVARIDEPPGVARIDGVRARQLHPHSRELQAGRSRRVTLRGSHAGRALRRRAASHAHRPRADRRRGRPADLRPAGDSSGTCHA
jgi:dihydroorotate dehydrogenase (fumarate)